MSQILSKIKRLVQRFPLLKAGLKKLHPKYYATNISHNVEYKIIYSYIAKLEERVRRLEGEGRPLMLSSADAEPSLERPVSQAATESQLNEPTFIRICRAIRYDPINHRKLWEYVYIVRALEVAGMLQPGMKGLGFGVGKDPMVAYMVKLGCHVTATDMSHQTALEKGWATTNQYSTKLEDLNERALVSDKLLKQNVKLRVVDMNSIPVDLQKEEFDFVWSACAFEHLGSIDQGLQFILESFKCLKPGGVAIHTTEFNASSNDETISSGDTVLFRRQDIEYLAERLRKVGGELELNFNLGNNPLDRFYDVAPYSEQNHMKLQLDKFVTTSFGLFVRKK